MEQQTTEDTKPEESESLQAQETTVVDDATSPATPGSQLPVTPPEPQKKSFKNKLQSFFKKINIYFLLLILLVLVAGLVGFVSYQKNKEETKKADISTSPLSQDVLDQLKQSDVRVGDPKQILSVESNAVFAGQVLIKGNLEVAGQIKSGVPLSLASLSVTGTTTFGKIQGSDLQITGNSTIQGQLTVQKGLTVSGSASVSGLLTAAQLNIQNLEVSGDLKINKHIDAGGGTPGKSNGSALGAGGTSSISGTDTAGTVSINTGGSAGAGCFVNITFVQKYNGTPHIVITPVGSAGGSVDFYINKSGSTGFSICTSNAPPSGASFGFDYIVID